MSILAIVVHSFNVIQKDIWPKHSSSCQVQAEARGFVDCILHQGHQVSAIHVGADDPVVVGDEHDAHDGI